MSPTTRSGQYKQRHPEKASEYAKRSNAQRPDRDRHDHDPCTRCGHAKTAHRHTVTTLCRTCWKQVGNGFNPPYYSFLKS